uniref:Cysteine rich protein 1 n=1 Tax=Serinus canaria TaxID=9135 RepID=A0A8C9MSP8_SERCA
MPKCPRCQKEVYFAEKVTSLGKDWHRPCLRCEKCNKTLTSGGHAEHDGKPYCNHPCYAALFGPKGGRACTSHTLCLIQPRCCEVGQFRHRPHPQGALVKENIR